MNRIIRWFHNRKQCPICKQKISDHGLWSLQKCLEELEKKK